MAKIEEALKQGQEHQRLAEQREQVIQSIRAIGHAYHVLSPEESA